jgi:sec-independent protein translocase protein TatB
MFDIGWTELLVVATVAIIVVGPKDLPRMLRSFGRTMGQVRRMSNDFKRQFDEALREAERESGLEETRKELQAVAKSNPIASAKKDFESSMRSADKPATADKPVPASSPEPETASAAPHEAEPVKTGAASERGSDAA